MATAQPPENAMLSEEALLAQKYGSGGAKKPGLNNILQKRLNKGQKYFDSGDYNMAKAKTPGIAKGQQSGIAAEQPPAEAQPQVQPIVVQQAPVVEEAHATEAASDTSSAKASAAVEPAGETTDTAADEQQRAYPRKAVPAASPLAKPPTPSADGIPASDAPLGGIPHPRALTAHLAHPTHTGPFVTHPERASPTGESPVAAPFDAGRRTSHDASAN